MPRRTHSDFFPREVEPVGGARSSCLGDEIIPRGKLHVAPPLKVPPPITLELHPAGYVAVSKVAAPTLVPAHAHTDKRARARGPGAVVGR